MKPMSEPTERKDTTHLQATGEFHSSGDFTSEESAPIARTDVQIPGYEILEELGRGGMGVVYKARHLALNRIVALKMILIRAHAHEKDRKRFQAEAEAVAQLQHPNIIQIFEIGEHEDLPFFSLELCPGGSLGDRLDGKPLKEKTAASIIRVLASAIQTAHEKGIVHRDLKPANILSA